MGGYYRKWNIVVHEWLFYYIYIDIRRFSRNRVSQGLATFATFIISAIVHEWILT